MTHGFQVERYEHSDISSTESQVFGIYAESIKSIEQFWVRMNRETNAKESAVVVSKDPIMRKNS